VASGHQDGAELSIIHPRRGGVSGAATGRAVAVTAAEAAARAGSRSAPRGGPYVQLAHQEIDKLFAQLAHPDGVPTPDGPLPERVLAQARRDLAELREELSASAGRPGRVQALLNRIVGQLGGSTVLREELTSLRAVVGRLWS